MNRKEIERLHTQILYPVVQVGAGKVGGSGTVIYSKAESNSSEEYETYVLTNHHVIESLIKIEERWSTLLQRNVKRDVKSTAMVEFFEYKWESRAIGGRSIDADIVAYDKNQDLALLQLRDIKEVQYVAKLYARGKERELYVFEPIYAVGAALRHPPVITHGHITGFGDEIENYEFWLCSAPTIYGNSGGAVFLDNGEFIGIPSRISVVLTGFAVDAITHMSYFIPITRIYNFLEEQVFNFIYDESYTSSQCAEIRKKKREAEELKLARKEISGEEEEN